MPHSSGGGSHGGGSHGGSHGGSSGPRVSKHYFAGAHRYARHYYSGAADEYVYASAKPQKTSLKSVIVLICVGVFCFLTVGLGIFTTIPNRLKTEYMHGPAINDAIDVIDNEDKLLETLEEYNEITGICPMIYTVYDEQWYNKHPSLESYAMEVYTDNFKDEQHWVIVYSIPMADAIGVYEGTIDVPDYTWEAIQGDETDNIITESFFEKFADIMQDDLEDGKGPGRAFDDAFKYAVKKAKSKLDPASPARYLSIIGSFMPLLFIGGIFVPLIVMSVKQYKKDKDIYYEEVPLDVTPTSPLGTQAVTSENGKTTTVVSGPGYYHKDVHYDMTSGKSPKQVKLITSAFMIPFFVVGIIVLVTGIAMLNSDNPKAEYPKSEYPDVTTSPADNSTQFDPQFFGSSKSDYEEDDEDYKRMKRQGYE